MAAVANYSTKRAKMAKYHLFLKFLAIEHCFGNYWGSTTFSGSRVWWARVPYFLIHRGTMTWKAGSKIFCLVLEHLKLEYWLNSTRVLHTRVPSIHLLHNHLLTRTGVILTRIGLLQFDWILVNALSSFRKKNPLNIYGLGTWCKILWYSIIQ